MRRNFYILWLDDEFDDSDNQFLDSLISDVEKHLKNDGYTPNIFKIKNINSANSYLSKKIDLFISDFNISDTENGFNFLAMVREKYDQDLILYSGTSIATIKEGIINYLSKDNTDINIFSRFSFVSTTVSTNLKNKICEIIDINLQRWSELNALRGVVLCEMSFLDYKLKDGLKNGRFDFTKLSNNLSNYTSKKVYPTLSSYLSNPRNFDLIDDLSFGSLRYLFLERKNSLFRASNDIVNLRNDMAHVKETWDINGYPQIVDLYDSDKVFKETDIAVSRKKLFDFLDKFYLYLDSLMK